MYRRRTPELRLATNSEDTSSTPNGTTKNMITDDKEALPPSPSRTKSSSSFSLSSPAGQRALLILAGLVSLFVVTRIFFPSDGSYIHSPLPLQPLIARNYLNSTKSEPAPFAFCPHYGPGDQLAAKYGAHNLARSKVHMGSGARIQRVVHKALSGLPVTISVLGGSVSACHGAGDNPISPKCYPSRFFNWWNSVFPHPASELTNGAMRRTDSAYFSFCSGHHLPDQTDLVILEFAADDPKDLAWIDHFDLLIRSILQRQDQPAVLILGHFSPQVHAIHGYNDPLHQHNLVAQFYDVPILSTKPAIFHDFISTPNFAKTTYWVDPILANANGHELLADVLIAYFQEMTCKGWDAALGRGFEVPSIIGTDAMGAQGAGGLFGGVGGRKGGADGPGGAGAAKAGAGGAGAGGANAASADTFAPLRVPPIRVNDRVLPHEGNVHLREPKPFCVSANDLINPLPPSLFYGSGWHAHSPGGGQAGATGYYWYSTLPTSKLRVPLRLTAGDVAIYSMVEPRGDYRDGGPGVVCWVDDNTAGGVEISGVGDVGGPTPKLTIIDRGVDAGAHFVECMLLGEEGEGSAPFKILGIFAT